MVVMVITALVLVDGRVQVELLRLLVFLLCGSCSSLDALQSIGLTQERRDEKESTNVQVHTQGNACGLSAH